MFCFTWWLPVILYAIGGFEEYGQRSSTVEKYDPEQDKWTVVKSMIYPRYCKAPAVLNGCLYVADGIGPYRSGTVEKYDPKQNIWTEVKSLAMFGSNTSVSACTAFRGMLYAIVERDVPINRLDLVKYDPETDTWSLIGSSNVTNFPSHKLIVLNQQIINITFQQCDEVNYDEDDEKDQNEKAEDDKEEDAEDSFSFKIYDLALNVWDNCDQMTLKTTKKIEDFCVIDL